MGRDGTGIDNMYAMCYNVHMKTIKYSNLRLHKDTLQELKIVAALAHESMQQTVQRLVRQEQARLQKEGIRDAQKL